MAQLHVSIQRRWKLFLSATILIGSLFATAFYFVLVTHDLKSFPPDIIRFTWQSLTAKEKVKEHQKVVLIFWSTFFGSTLECSIDRPNKYCNNSRLQNCRVPCEITSNRSRASEAAAMIVHTRDPYPLPPETYRNNIPWILFGVENPVYTPTLYDKKFLANFNYLYSYNLEQADFYVASFDKPSVKPLPLPFSKKNGLVLAVFSHCEAARTAYLKELMKYIQVDSYGSCLRNKPTGELAGRSSKDFKKAKTELARRYKFTLVFFNQDCDYFVDDQLTHALNAGSVPVYMGTEKIHELMAGNLRDALIKVKDFKTPKDLAEYLKVVSENENLYNRYLRWKYQGFNFPANYSSTKHGLAWARDEEHPYPDYCFVCEKIEEFRGKPMKPAGQIKPEYCKPRKITDWLNQLNRTTGVH